MARKSRQTLRKRLLAQALHELFDGGPVLLEELRWNVFTHEMKERRLAAESMEDSYRASFNRTARSPLPGIKRLRIPAKQSRQYPGLISRAAVFRMKKRSDIDRFFDTVITDVGMDIKVVPAADRARKIAYYVCEVAGELPSGMQFRVFVNIPCNTSFVVLSTRSIGKRDLERIADVPWRLIGWGTEY